MTSHETLPSGSTNADGSNRALVEKILRAWDQGVVPSARQAIESNPCLAVDHSIIIELAYEEYRRRKEVDLSIDAGSFCALFPEVERSLRDVIEVDLLVSNNASALGTPAAPNWPRIGDDVHGCRIIEELGRGAFSRVYLVHQEQLGDRKTVLKATTDEHEAQTLGRLDHSAIVPIYSVHTDVEAGLCLLCMPYCGRITLAAAIDFFRRQRGLPNDGSAFAHAASIRDEIVRPIRMLTSREPGDCGPFVDAVVRLAIQIAHGLEHAHQQGILHLDLKPSNVLLSFAGEPLILDFNLSSDARGKKRRLGGTLPYMSPEALRVITGTGASVVMPDERADVFGIGLIMYELLTLRRPFANPPVDLPLKAAAGRRLVQLQESFEPITSFRPQIDPCVAAVVHRCLSFEPAQRPQSAAEVAELLGEHFQWRRRTGRLVRRHSKLVGTVFVTGILCLLLIGVWVVLRPPYHVRQHSVGIELMGAGRYDAALDRFDDALQHSPEYAEAMLSRGIALTKLGRLNEALAMFENSDLLMPSPSAKSGTIYILGRKGEFSKIAKRSDLIGSATDAATLNNAGVALANQLRLDEAANLFDCARRSPGAPAVVFYNSARLEVYKLLGNLKHDPAEGILWINRAIELGLDRGQVYLYAAILNCAGHQSPPESLDRAKRMLHFAAERGASVSMIRMFPVITSAISPSDVDRAMDVAEHNKSAFAVELLVMPF